MIELPPGYTVNADTAVGSSYYDDTGNIIYQYPSDGDLARMWVWRIYHRRMGTTPDFDAEIRAIGDAISSSGSAK